MRRLAWLSLVLALLACGGDETKTGAGPLTVAAAASLTEVFPLIDPDPQYNFAGSDELATQIREGAPADVYAAASSKYPQELFDEGLVEEPVTFASNRLVLIVPADNPAGIEDVGDVAEPGTRLVIAAEGVPVGDYTRQVLEDMGLTAALDNVVSNEDDVKGVVGKVTLGEADAGFVYATDATVAGDDVSVIELPEGSQPPIEYQIAVVVGSGNREAAEAFVELVLGDEGREQLEAAGFILPWQDPRSSTLWRRRAGRARTRAARQG
jgi:molybdate transport system substrate-binding protein